MCELCHGGIGHMVMHKLHGHPRCCPGMQEPEHIGNQGKGHKGFLQPVGSRAKGQ